MLARTAFDQDATAALAVSQARVLRTVRRLPYRQLHALVKSVAWAETWLRWPLRTLRMLDWVNETMHRLDPDGGRFGLTKDVRDRFRRNLLYDGMTDLAVLISRIDDPAFRRRALIVEGRELLDRERVAGPGALVLGFRLGSYPVIPMAMGALGYDVTMIVGSNQIMRQAQGLGEEFAPDANERVRYVCAQDSLVLARSLEALNQGRLVSTLMELSSLKFAKTAEVKFLDWAIRVPYGIPYLSAMTKRSIVPAVLTRDTGMRYRLRFLEPLPAPARDRASILGATQDLYSVLEREVRRAPDQWAGWTTLESNLGIDLGRPVLLRVPAVS